MRIIIFIVFIMMIIIFINELKNISMSFFKINYIKDVSDINIKKHCNDIYCEAETGRFNIAKNSYNLLLPNDIFNTKAYYFMIALIIIIFYINTFYKFIKHNNIYYPYISDFDGSVLINVIKNIPYIFGFLTLMFIIVILIMRYAPTETVGYRNYFNIDNEKVSEIHFLNINKLYNNIILILLIIFLTYIMCISVCNSNLYDYPEDAKVIAIINRNLCIGYLIITILLTYLILNIMNILLTFSDNRFPKLDNNNFYNIILKNYKDVLDKTEADTYNYGKDNLLLRCYTEILTQDTIPKPDYGNDIIYYEKKDDKYTSIKYGITVANAIYDQKTVDDDATKAGEEAVSRANFQNEFGRNYKKIDETAVKEEASKKFKEAALAEKNKKTHIVYYDDIDYIEKKDNARDVYIDDKLKVNKYFKFVSPLIPKTKLEDPKYFPTDGQDLLRYYDKHKKNYDTYKDIHGLNIQSDNPPITNEDNLKIRDKYETILDKYKEDNYYDQFYMINSIRIGHFTKANKFLNNLIFDTLFDYMKNAGELTIELDDKYNILLNLLIYFSLNEINYWIKHKSKDIYNEENYYPDYNYIDKTIFPDYEKHKILLNLIKFLKEQKINSKKILEKHLTNKTTNAIKLYLIAEIEKYTEYTNAASTKKVPFFGKEYNALNNVNENKENFSADISYNSENTFYEKYFNISNNDNSIYDIEYKVGNYFIKNIKSLIYYIILILIISVILIISLYINNQSSLTTFSYDVVIPLIILLIFTFYITIFMNFNTNYNLNVIYGLFDSSYKRDLNDMNNLIIPFIKLHDNNQKRYDKDYYELYIITNVLASFIYRDDTNPDSIKYSTMATADKYSKEEARDYNDFRKYYNEQFIKINKEFEKDWDKSNNLAKLYDFINEEIIEISKGSNYDKENFIKKFTDYGTNKIINVIKICLELFGNNKDAYKNNELISKYVYFEKDKNGEIIPHKFRLKISIFKELKGVVSNGYYDDGGHKIRVFNDDEKEKNINNIIKNYMTIISYLHFNTLLFAPFKKMEETSRETNFRPPTITTDANKEYSIIPISNKFTYKSMTKKTYYHVYKTGAHNFNPDKDIKCDILVVGGGGGGSTANNGGGGGGGGVIFKKNIEIKSIAGGYSISIGIGTTNDGVDTTLGDYTAKGGKKGQAGQVGKEGEGGSSGDILYKGAEISDGNSGGNGFKTIAAPTTFTKGGGGGGAGGKGVDGTETKAGNGGIGIDASSSIPSSYGVSGHFGGGGGGGNGTDASGIGGGTGGTGGGGSEDVIGTANTGGGGGARDKTGGSGVVIIKYVLYQYNTTYYVIDEKETNYFNDRAAIYNNIDNLDANNLTPGHLHDHLHKYKNKRLLSLISNTKKFDKYNFKLASGTFDKNSRETDDIKYIYTNIIETYNVNVANITENYLENVINTICYQIDNRDVIMNNSDDVLKEDIYYSIKNKNGDAHDNQLNILHKANQCIGLDFAANYTINLIMLVIIYYIGLYNNKIF